MSLYFYEQIFRLDNATSPVTIRSSADPSIFVFDFRRKMALKLLAQTPGASVRFHAITPHQLAQKPEAFLTQTTAGIVPVVRVDGQTLGNGRPGPHTLALMRESDEFVRAMTAKQFIIATGVAMAIAVFWGFCETFANAPHLPAWLIYPLFWAAQGVVSPFIRSSR